jgi:preprotein translocase subunit SecB
MTAGNGQNPETPQGIRLLAQYLKDLSFESPRSPHVFQKIAAEKPAFNVGINVQGTKAGDNVFEVVLDIRVESSLPDLKVFLIELKYAGLFAIQGVTDEILQQIMLIECPTILFPFARRIVADLTTDGGFFPLLLDPMDFRGLYISQQQKKASTGADESSRFVFNNN